MIDETRRGIESLIGKPRRAGPTPLVRAMPCAFFKGFGVVFSLPIMSEVTLGLISQ